MAVVMEAWSGLESRKEKDTFCILPSTRPWHWSVVILRVISSLLTVRAALQLPSRVWLPKTARAPPGDRINILILTVCLLRSVTVLAPSQLSSLTVSSVPGPRLRPVRSAENTCCLQSSVVMWTPPDINCLEGALTSPPSTLNQPAVLESLSWGRLTWPGLRPSGLTMTHCGTGLTGTLPTCSRRSPAVRLW